MALPEGRARSGFAVAMILAFAVVAVIGVALRPLLPIDETRYIDVAREMRLEGSWFLPLKNFELYTDKPPLLFWLINLVWTLVGEVSGFAGRLVGPFFAVVTLVGTWALGRRLWDNATGALAAIVLSGLSVFAAYGGATMFDTLLSTATFAGLWALISALRAPGVNRLAWGGFGLALAFGVLAKGPVILFHLAPALLAVPLWADPSTRPSGREIAKGAGLALAVALAVVALWVLPAAITGGAEYRRMILWEQTAGRTVQSFAHARPMWWLLATLPLALFPWIWSPSFWRGAAKLRLSDRALRLMVVQAGAGLFLFSLISGKQVHYLVPELPAFALIVARAFLASGSAEARGRWSHLPVSALLVLAGIAPLALALGAGDVQTVALMQPLWGPIAFALFCSLLAALVWLLPRVIGLSLAGLGLVLGFVGLIASTGLGPAYDSTPIAQRMAAHQAQGLATVAGRYNSEFGFEGRLTEKVDILTAEDAPAWLTAHPGGLLVAECRDVPTLEKEAAEVRFFYGHDWCLWQGE
ncbi:4-amino-4-deoxy-L-arabinose transferase-like glycosyltransferase [Rhodobacter sp. JA431]|uniref:ArnT family glycosyltransferase n=1 Tax=Rhodobacter sp. JA431 TaxID=570013 RepID=UPI000BD5869F|nr:glycosyltransferase family 39 protein [Rhodobacter sp. JA431]SOC18943.1 4-amino-4-deoxy-L-arabinose transferase-like glycosyltransferase [Rhodobacter sp. JA431]